MTVQSQYARGRGQRPGPFAPPLALGELEMEGEDDQSKTSRIKVNGSYVACMRTTRGH